LGADGALELSMAYVIRTSLGTAAARRQRPALPPPTEAELAAAWARYQVHARGPHVPANLAQALAHRTLGPVLQASARQARTEAWLASATRVVDLVPAVRLGLDGHPMGWQTRQGPAWHQAAAVDQPSCFL
jgi:hypothetical protein